MAESPGAPDPARWSVGAFRRLGRLTSEDGHLKVLAVDHRDGLRVEFDPDRPEAVPGTTLTRFKADVTAGLGIAPTAVMLEPEYSLPELLADGTVPASVGVFGALEAQGYLAASSDGGVATNAFLPDWSADRLLRMGGDGAKILVLYRPDRGEHTATQERFVAAALHQAHDAGLPLLVEPVPFELSGPEDRQRTIVESARRIGALGPMILKLPFPGRGGCADLDDAATPHPWALLSWGVPYVEFRDQLAEAVTHGCSGFAVGRALWREALEEGTRSAALAGHVRPRFAELSAIASTGRSVYARVKAPIG